MGGLIYLIDTNVWLELLLEQEREAEVRQFFQNVEGDSLAITEFSLYSIGIILTRLKKDHVFEDFLADTIENSGVIRICLDISDLKKIIEIRQHYQMDFDDAYQYVAATKYNYTLISFDTDFDLTDKGRKTPSEAFK